MGFAAALSAAITGELRLAVEELYLLRVQFPKVKNNVALAL